MDQGTQRIKILYIDTDFRAASKIRTTLTSYWTKGRWEFVYAANFEYARDLIAHHKIDVHLVRVATRSGVELDQMHECHRLARGQPFFAVILEQNRLLRAWVKQHGFQLLFEKHDKLNPMAHEMAQAYGLAPVVQTSLSQPWLPGSKLDFRQRPGGLYKKMTANKLLMNPKNTLPTDPTAIAVGEGRPDYLKLQLPPKGSFRYEDLNLQMFVELARLVRSSHGYLTIRILANNLGLSKSAVARRLSAAVKKGILDDQIFTEDMRDGSPFRLSGK